jgi:pimeloyl-ACP methyl ester carboxylesterase
VSETAARPWPAIAALTLVAGALLVIPGADPWANAAIVVIAVISGILVWRPGVRWTGAPMFVWGLLGVALGAVGGLRPLTAGQTDLRGVLGGAALVAGIYLVAAGGVRLVRRTSLPVRIVGTVGLVVMALVTLYVVAVGLLATVPLKGAPPTTAPDGFVEIEFTTADEVTLQGWYAASTNGAGVVVVPGSGSTRAGALAQAQLLAEAGYGVLVYDPRGHGGSGGAAMDLGWAGDLDVPAAVTTLLAQPGVRTVGALGLSMGGEQVLGAAANDDRIAAVVAEGATNRVTGDLQWLSSEYGIRGSIQIGLEHVQQAITEGLTPYAPPATLRSAVRAISPRPVLLITAGRRPDEGIAAQFTAEGQSSVTIWTVPGATHTAGLAVDPAAWSAQVLGFFDRTLT